MQAIRDRLTEYGDAQAERDSDQDTALRLLGAPWNLCPTAHQEGGNDERAEALHC
jgi:hypothetical protein